LSSFFLSSFLQITLNICTDYHSSGGNYEDMFSAVAVKQDGTPIAAGGSRTPFGGQTGQGAADTVTASLDPTTGHAVHSALRGGVSTDWFTKVVVDPIDGRMAFVGYWNYGDPLAYSGMLLLLNADNSFNSSQVRLGG
jgi:hypothetical protein